MNRASHPAPIKRDILIAAIPFVLGTGSLFLVDIILGRRLDGSDLSDWAYVRSAVLIATAIGVFGVDQALLRRLVEPSKLMRPAIVQAVIGGVGSTLLSCTIADARTSVFVGLIVTSLVFATIFAGYLRSRVRIAASLSGLYGWRVVLLVAVAAFGDVLWPPLALWLASIASAVFAFVVSRRVEAATEPGDRSAAHHREILTIGSRFCLTNVIAVSSIYIDQIILEVFGLTETSTQAFLYTTAIYPLPILAAGFGANIYNPWLRSTNRLATIRKKKFAQAGVLGAAAVLGLIASAVSFLLVRFVFGSFDSVDKSLMLGFVVVAALRVTYVIPSGIIGVFGRLNDITRLGISGLVTVAISPAIFLSASAAGASAIDSIWMAILASTSVRLVAGLTIATSILARDGELSLEVE